MQALFCEVPIVLNKKLLGMYFSTNQRERSFQILTWLQWWTCWEDAFLVTSQWALLNLVGEKHQIKSIPLQAALAAAEEWIMQWSPQISPSPESLLTPPKISVIPIKYSWKKQPWSTEGSPSSTHNCEHCIQLTNYAKGEKGELLPQPVHAFLERCFGSLETWENSCFSLCIMKDEKMKVGQNDSPTQAWSLLLWSLQLPHAAQCLPTPNPRSRVD